MLFNSWIFAAFFAITYALYLLTQRHRVAQNVLLLLASYVFYGWWSWKFLALIALSTAIDYLAGLKIANSTDETARKRWVTLSVVSNLGILGFFKYTNFFLDSLAEILTSLGLEAAMPSLSIVLPVGISFYTFQSMSYTIDVYRKKTTPTLNLLDFAVYVSFFPQLVAGPIERSARFLPQVQSPRRITLSSFETGVYLVLWGLFKKIVIADNAAAIADPIFADVGAHSGAELWLGALAFTLQIFGDFSGYTDMARGLARMMGFELMLNFRLPYFAVSPSDFWLRWHVSLSSWLRDYLYIPLGGNRRGIATTYRNLMLTMLLGGLWHGAAWNFVVWGAYHGVLLVLYRIVQGPGGNRLPSGRWVDPLRVAIMFPLTVIGWVIFRMGSIADLRTFFSQAWVDTPADLELAAATLGLLWLPVLLMDLAQLYKDDLLAAMRLPVLARGILYGLLVAACIAFARGKSMEFIYFQF